MDKPADDKKGAKHLVSILSGGGGDEQHTSQDTSQSPSMDRQIKKKKWPPRRIATYALGVIFAIVIGYQLLYGVSASTLNVDAEKLTIATITYGPFQEFIAEQGAVVPLTIIYLDAEEGGRVEEKYVEEGVFLQEGDPILRLSNTNLLLSVMQREAELFREVNNLRSTRVAMEQRRLGLRTQMVEIDYQVLQLRRNYERNKGLLKEDLISQEEYDRSREEYDYMIKRQDVTQESIRQDSLFQEVQIAQLESSVARLQANLRVIKQNEENLTLRAPVTGRLTALDAEIGESKTQGQRLGQLDVEEGFKVRAEIDEHYIARIRKGQTGTFDFAGGAYNLMIAKVYLEVVGGQFEADMEFVGEVPQGLRRGQTLQIRLALGDLSDAILVPRGGFYQKTGGQWVYVVDPSGEFAVKRPIRIGRQNPRFFEVLEGLEPDERVITSMYDNFGDMDRLVLK